SWTYIGCSAQSVPSLSKTAIRSAGGTNVEVPARVVSATNLTIACFGGSSFHDGSGAVSSAAAGAPSPTAATPDRPSVTHRSTRHAASLPRRGGILPSPF